MTDAPVLVVGAGIAGLSAAVSLAEAGLPSIVADQAAACGGMIHRQPLPGVAHQALAPAHRHAWVETMAGVRQHEARIRIRTASRFAGIDHTGTALIAGANGGFLRPRALILATGASERVMPRPGWTLPGVRTAGSIQIHLKTTGEAPAPRILLAGSGPLLFAIGAQLARAGAPPVAIVEAGQPFARGLAALRLPLDYLTEAAGYMAILFRYRVPILTCAEVARIEPSTDGLSVVVAGRSGLRNFSADLIGLHDGIRRNDYGAANAAIPVISAGDCREALGARAAALDGAYAGRVVVARLSRLPEPSEPRGLARERRAQAVLARLYRHDDAAGLARLPDDTVICRCENRTLADLRALGAAPTVREVRLNGRFSMGACQGRFCGEWVAHLLDPASETTRIGTARWPVRPIAVADILDAEIPSAAFPGE